MLSNTNPLLVEGQIQGGIAQGLGQALYEELVFDENGQVLTGEFMDYALPHAAHTPRYHCTRSETATQANLLGVKGVGESGTIGATPAVVNAVLDALKPLNITKIVPSHGPVGDASLIDKNRAYLVSLQARVAEAAHRLDVLLRCAGDDRTALGHHEAVASSIKRARRAFRLVVQSSQCPRCRESGEGKCADDRLGTTGTGGGTSGTGGGTAVTGGTQIVITVTVQTNAAGQVVVTAPPTVTARFQRTNPWPFPGCTP